MNRILFAKLAVILLAFCIAAITSSAQTETILHSFTCQPTDGCSPNGGVTVDSSGNIYGTTITGGSNGAGTVFELTTSGQFSLLYSFGSAPSDGFNPYEGVTLDSHGNIYGTTYEGGLDQFGTVFKLTPTGTETILYSFTCGTDGCLPQSVPALDKDGNIYGTTTQGGADGWGTVFKITPSGTFSTLYGFTGGADGGGPGSNLYVDSKLNVYGTTYSGGAFTFGAAFKITSAGVETVLHSFDANGKDGFWPFSGLIPGKVDFYGTSGRGGSIGVGAIFSLAPPDGTEHIVHSFKGGADGIFPVGTVALDSSGNLYGATHFGGTYDLGTVFKLTASGAETILHSFAFNGTDGTFPLNGLAIDSSGNLYGVTTQGGSSATCEGGCGAVFKVVP